MAGNARPRPGPAAGAAGRASACFTNAWMSSLRMRSLGPVPLTLPRFTPSSRAKRRTAGLACARAKPASSTGPWASAGAAAGAGAGVGAGAAVRAWTAGAAGCAAGAGAGSGFGAAAAAGLLGVQGQNDDALGDFVTQLDAQLLDHARERGRHLHRRLVALQRDQRVLRLDCIAGLDHDFDHRDILEVADIGYHHLLDRSQGLLRVGYRRSAVGYTSQGQGLLVSIPYLRIASVTRAAGRTPSSARAFNAATVT